MDQELNQCTSRAELEAILEHIRTEKQPPPKYVPHMPLDKPRSQLAASANTANALTTSIQQAALTASGISGRIRAALLLYERAQEAREYIDQVITLKTSLISTQDAIDTKNWERAASSAQRALELPQSLLQSEFALRMVPSTELPEEPEVTLKAACDGMASYFLKEFDIACAARDTAALTRWFKLLPQVNHRREGLERYARFVAGIVAGQSRNLLAEASNENQSLYGIAMSRLFESIAAILDQHSKLVEKYYGDSMAQVIDVIQNEVDVQGGLIIDTWLDERRIEELMSDIAAYQYPGLVTLLGIPTEGSCYIDLDNVVARISELHLMLNRWQLYVEFLERWPLVNTESSALCAKFREILKPCFDKLTIFVFRRSVERALSSIELPSPAPYTNDSPLVSSAVDQITITLSTLIDQVMGTASTDVEQTVFQSLLRVLKSDYLKIMDRKILASNTKATRFSGYVYLNDLEVTSLYLAKIVDRAKEQYPDQEHAVLDKLVTKFKEAVKDVINEFVRSQYNSQWASQCRSLCGQQFKGNYLVSPAEPESLRGKDFEVEFEKMVTPLKQSLCPTIYIKFMSCFSQTVARLLEKWIFSLEKGINELGAIALDRDVTKIVACISKSQYSLRENFSKIANMVNQIETGQEDENALEMAEIEMLRKVVV